MSPHFHTGSETSSYGIFISECNSKLPSFKRDLFPLATYSPVHMEANMLQRHAFNFCNFKGCQVPFPTEESYYSLDQNLFSLMPVSIAVRCITQHRITLHTAESLSCKGTILLAGCYQDLCHQYYSMVNTGLKSPLPCHKNANTRTWDPDTS